MRIIKLVTTAAATLTLAASLTSCQFTAGAVDTALDQARQGLHETQGSLSGTESASAGAAVPAHVLRVIDGDTIAVEPGADLPATNDAGTEHTVRLLGIDTPEMNKMSDEPPECGAQAALDHLAELLRGADDLTLVFDAHADQTDRFGRSLAYVLLPDSQHTDVALRMARDGLAEAWYPRGEPEPERYAAYAAAEAQAAALGAGLHAECDSIGR